MAQAGSAQREPSMEEILASIRRIIEDSDAVGAPSEEADQRGDFEVTAANTQTDAASEVAAFRLELDEPTVVHTPPVVDSPVARKAAEVSFEPVMQPVADVHTLHADPEPARAQVEESLAPALDKPAQPVETSAFVVAAEASVKEELRTSLISEQPARQVAAAFGELSDAFAASRRRSFDEMAEEMLRPMLQEWLDNNLPNLVEKLVREEIERVARGS
ncbi:PopZ family protein [Aerobium aerolatum]|uniref:Cell pole-organizing protein PopZ n=1 Tax=Aquamicrobium aerolatum DSM 21857 TaxID=1121003 RepID=A0A1I3PDY4_9HYPH|nr:PopZ family protein [Aquamicrobium aerolatum]SFJ19631.1 hypothetical protein SAMN03080618_02306 [Aquamicrobium aerolatum DSM 21857]